MQRTAPHERLKELRKRTCTQAALADFLGCAPSYISKLENAERNPGRAIAWRLEQFSSAHGYPIAIADWDEVEREV
jgi:transcriptional regulator with XRE-family HTH domain